VVAQGSSAPNLLGKFNDRTSIEADRTGTTCDGNVYFSWSRFSGNNGGVAIYFSRSTDHGVTFSKPMKLSASIHDVQFPDISVTHNGHVYVTFRQIAEGPAAQRDHDRQVHELRPDVLAAGARDDVHAVRRAGRHRPAADPDAAGPTRRPGLRRRR
jgi:hypothetical protein